MLSAGIISSTMFLVSQDISLRVIIYHQLVVSPFITLSVV